MRRRSISKIAVPLRSLDPTDDDSDLDVLGDVVGDARVVCIGESAHFVSEFNRLRDRMTRFLVREHGFSAFVLESGLPEGLVVDKWVHGGPGEVAAIARSGISYAFGRCAEMHAQLQWMRDWNTTGSRRVGFYGMDVPGWCVNPGPGVRACLARIPAQRGDRDLLAVANLGNHASEPPLDATGACLAPAGLSEALTELVARAEAAGDDLARQCARGALRVVEFLDHGLYPGPGRNLRNEVMAENLSWILEREDRVVAAAHNVHLLRGPSFDGTTTIGSLLARTLSENLIIIGGTHAAGRIPDLDLTAPPDQRYTVFGDEPPPPPAHSLEAVLDAAGYPVHLTDLRRAPPDALADATVLRAQTPHQTLLIELDPPAAFDAVAHIHTITPVRGVPD